MKKCNTFWGPPKNIVFRGVHKKPIYRRDCLKRGLQTVSRFKEGLARKTGGVFQGS